MANSPLTGDWRPWTLCTALLFALGYGGWDQWRRLGSVGATRGAQAAAARPDDASLWALSRNPTTIAAGRRTFESNCAACHLASLRGKSEDPATSGPDLTDQQWIHGGRPTQVFHTVAAGVPDKGMPTWGPVLGPQRISEVVAYVMSHHREGEPILAANR